MTERLTDERIESALSWLTTIRQSDYAKTSLAALREVQRLRTALGNTRTVAKQHSKGGPLAGSYQWFMQELDKALEGGKEGAMMPKRIQLRRTKGMIASVVVGSRTLLLYVDDPPPPEPWGEFRVVGEPKPIRRRQRRKPVEPMKEESKVIPELREECYEEWRTEEAIRRLAEVRAQLGRPRHPVRWR